jgi:hypothetical protein
LPNPQCRMLPLLPRRQTIGAKGHPNTVFIGRAPCHTGQSSRGPHDAANRIVRLRRTAQS